VKDVFDLNLNLIVLQLVSALSVLQQTSDNSCSGLLLEGVLMFKRFAGAIVLIVSVVVVLVMLYRGGFLAFGGERERVESMMVLRQIVIALLGFIVLAYALAWGLQKYVFTSCANELGWPHDWLKAFFAFLGELGEG